MTQTAGSMIDQAEGVALDEVNLWFPRTQWLDWYNDALRAVVNDCPEAGTVMVIGKLSPGVRQELPVDGARLVDVPRNLRYGLASVSIAATDADKLEGDSGSTPFVFTLTRVNQLDVACSVDYAVTTPAGGGGSAADFVGGIYPFGTVSFGVGDTVQTLNIMVAGDLSLEGDETFTVTISNPENCVITTATANGTIRNDDCYVSIAATTADRAEGNSGSTNFTFTVTRTGYANKAISVDWAVTGSGLYPANAADFAGGVLPSGTLSLASGVTSGVITVQAQGDATYEEDEQFTVTLSNPVATFINVSTANGIIRNDDPIMYDVYAFGVNAAGAFGNGNNNSSETPILVASNIDAKYITSNESSAYITSSGQLWVCGLNSNYELGLGHNSIVTTWTQVTGVWKKIIFSHAWSIAQDVSGRLYHAGYRGFGYDNSGASQSDHNISWVDTGIVCDDFALGSFHGIAIGPDKRSDTCYAPLLPIVRTWGANGQRQLGQDDPVLDVSPHDLGTAVRLSYCSAETGYQTASTSENVFCGNASASIIYHQNIGFLAVGSQYDNLSNTTYIERFETVTGISSPSFIKGSLRDIGQGNVVILDADGAAWCVGDNNHGCHGDGGTTRNTAFVRVGGGGGHVWKDVCLLAPFNAVCSAVGLKNNGTLWGWGAPTQNGFGGASDVTSPAQIGTDTDWARIAGTGKVGFALKVHP